MIVGLILLGSMAAAGVSITALVLGFPIWAALLLYSLTGMAVVLTGATLSFLRQTRPARPEPQAYPLAAAPRG